MLVCTCEHSCEGHSVSRGCYLKLKVPSSEMTSNCEWLQVVHVSDNLSSLCVVERESACVAKCNDLSVHPVAVTVRQTALAALYMGLSYIP